MGIYRMPRDLIFQIGYTILKKSIWGGDFMAGTKHCMECGEKVPLNYKTCPYCGFNYEKFMKGFSMPDLKKAINKKGKVLIFR